MNPNSSLCWLPPIQAAGLPVPRTVVVPYEHHKFVALMEGEGAPTVIEPLIDQMDAAALSVGGYPVFIRTDLGSAKHSGPKAYRADNRNELQDRIFRTAEDQEMKFWPMAAPQAFLVREFLDLDSYFTAFSDLPIAREFRFFANKYRVICWHPYWPAGAIENPSSNLWEGFLAAQHVMATNDLDKLSEMAIRAAAACGEGDWSVDFAIDKAGNWWLPDMATMRDSFHWTGCPNGPS